MFPAGRPDKEGYIKDPDDQLRGTAEETAPFATPEEPEGSLLTPILEIFGSEDAWADGWRVEPGDHHVRVRNERVELPEQGWKLHVSAEAASAKEVLRRALPVLLAERAAFKVVSSLARLGSLNEGRDGLSQVGKFITVYPADDARAVRLAVALDGATRGLRGPPVPSDRPLAPGSLVHYRYGGFGTRLVQMPSGEVTPALVSPGGELVPDGRSAAYRAPGWAVDPFVAAGVVQTGAQRRPVGGRYMITGTAHRSPAGEIHRALDMRSLRRCVLKRRGPGAHRYLRNEAGVLRRVAPDDRFPEVYGLIEEGNDLFLAMEEVEGETMRRHVVGLGRLGKHVAADRVVLWGRELAAILGKIHARRLVYRDLKMENVILAPDGRLRLLDFELACEPGEEKPLGGLGTRGYCSPQQLRGEPPAVTDDIYSLGALLYAALTGTVPELAPGSSNLLARPIRLLNPAAGPELVAVISRCLDPDPAGRYPSMVALDGALAKVGAGVSVRPPEFGQEPTPEHHYRGLGRRLGDTLCRVARRAPHGVLWLSEVPGVGEFPLRDLCAGNAGTVLALAELVAEFGEPRHRLTLEQGAHWLARSSPMNARPLPGLYVGEAGVGAALLRAGQVLGDSGLVSAAEEKGRFVSSLPHLSADLFNGSAGRLRFHLLLWDETAASEHLGHAVEAGERLLERAETGGGLRWKTPRGYGAASGAAQLGYAHGAAGIGDALLDLFEATGDERFLAGARGAGRWIAPLAIPVLDDESGLDWPVVDGGPPFGPAWCHGATGIGRFFMHAARLDVLSEAADLAARAAHTAGRGSRARGPTQCHGLAGNVEFLLDMHEFTGDGAYLVEARSLGFLLEAFSQERDGALVWPSDSPDVFVPDYMTGYAGVAACLLRLDEAESVPHQLSRRGFRRQTPRVETVHPRGGR